MKREFPYKTSYSSLIRPVLGEERDKYLAQASLKDVAKLMPGYAGSNAETSDLLPIAFNAFVANRANKKFDVCDASTAVNIAKFFVNKPINVEHIRNRVIGTILTYGFSKFGSDEQITEEEAIKSTEPFNVVLGGVLWRLVEEDIVDKIEESGDPSEESYQTISASWEVGFTDFYLALNSEGSKNLEDCDILKDKEKIKELKDYMKSNGGKGSKDDNVIYRVVSGTVVPLGIGLTESPAADVKGVATPKTIETKEEEEVEVDDSTASDKNNTSQEGKNDVIQERINTMKVTKIEDINKENWDKIEASQVSDFLTEKLAEANKAYLAEKNKLEDSLKSEKEAIQKLEASNKKNEEDLKKTQDEFSKVQKELQELKEAAANREKQDKFNGRMAKLDESYKLTDEEKQVVASEIINLDDEAFAKYESKLAVLFKRGAAVASTKEKEEKKGGEATASEDNPEKALDAAEKEGKKEKQANANTSSAGNDDDYYARYKDSFSAEGWISDVELK